MHNTWKTRGHAIHNTWKTRGHAIYNTWKTRGYTIQNTWKTRRFTPEKHAYITYIAPEKHAAMPHPSKGAGIARWLEHRTRDWKVAGSNPCWNGGRIFFSRVDFLCWLLFRYPFHPRVTTVARKKSRSFCQKCRWQVTAKHAYTLRMWILLNRASALVTTCP